MILICNLLKVPTNCRKKKMDKNQFFFSVQNVSMQHSIIQESVDGSDNDPGGCQKLN